MGIISKLLARFESAVDMSSSRFDIVLKNIALLAH